jgi:hypothetical protein
MIPPTGTFNYSGTLITAGALPWNVELSAVAEFPSAHPHLAGSHAWLRVEEGGPNPSPGHRNGVWRRAGMRARFSVLAEPWNPSVRPIAHFHVDLGLARAAHAGDVLFLSRTDRGGVGLSLLREGALVYAVGAVTAVPIGDGNSARLPIELSAEAEAVFRRLDPTFALYEVPLELTLGGRTILLPSGGPTGTDVATADGFDVAVLNGFLPGPPACDAYAAVSRRLLCSETSAKASAHLLAADGLTLGG